jgi:serine/threonine protein kinase
MRGSQNHEKLRHEAIAQLYGRDARFLSVYREEIEARDLTTRGAWRDEVSDEFTGDRNDAVRIIREVAVALDYMHSRGLVHNDIKPGNILYSHTRGAVLCDLGLSSDATDYTSNGGTPYYVPPEYIGNRSRGPPGDVWALGITMLYLLRKMSLPDSRGRRGNPRHLYWFIADVNSRRQGKNAPLALNQMKQWLADVSTASKTLDTNDPLERLVKEMLMPTPTSRINTSGIVKRLRGLPLGTQTLIASSSLEDMFPEATKQDFAWITELIDVGYAYEDISELLFERTHDSPWLYFEPKAIPAAIPETHYHITSCAHNTSNETSDQDQLTLLVLQPDQEQELRRSVEELCGIGGVTPSSRDKSKWRGAAEFSHQNSAVSIRLVNDTEHVQPLGLDVVHRLIAIAQAVNTAVHLVQSAQLCCDSFTLLRLARPLSRLEMPRIRFSIITEIQFRLLLLSKSLENGSNLDNTMQALITSTETHELARIAREIITGAVGDHINYEANDLWATLHLVALALQTMSLAFVSYTQAHVGALQPFFLDTPLQSVSLHGLAGHEQSSIYVVAELVELSCLGDMLQGHVLAFHEGGYTKSYSGPLDVDACPSDILDTWGPGDYVFSKGSRKQPVALKIGGGYISPPSEEWQQKYHWAEPLILPANDVYLDIDSTIIVGGLVSANTTCPSDEQACWNMSSGMFEELGTYRSHYEVSETQAGFQAGPDHVSFITSRVWAKRRGRTVKSQNLEQKDHMLVPFLESHWGVRVSYCTGLAQRVPLRQLVADLLPSFAKTHTGMAALGKWTQLTQPPHDICEAFQRVNSSQLSLSDWLGTLPEDLYDFVLALIRQILNTLKHTGLSPDGSSFLVAWPWNGIVNRCFRIPLEGGNKWIPVLADSDDCATFAYITVACLQSATVKCRGPQPMWQDRLHMLETAVLCPTNTSSWALHNERTYFFVKLDNNLFWVKARKETTEPASLVRLYSAQSLPRDLRQRLLFKEAQKRERRLREKDRTTVLAEDVGIS